ncbi:MAG TPA: complex I NDUFA9 subunit family protein, partial [Mariprofundaceae bacterium]|nr:complex I NDUFA9 subunit family protein [Mariprofundaceae bacterium]
LCVVGGSGFVGRAIVQEAVRRGHQVTVACRHPERSRELINEGVRLVRADIVDGRGLDEAIREADVVINLVGLLFEKGRYTFDAAHVHGTDHVLAACKQAGVKQYLHMSALGAGEVPASKYSRTKGEAEGHVRQSGLNWTIFRPSIIYGAGDSFFNKFKAMSSTLPVFPVIAGETRFQPVWVEDVARAFIMAIGSRHVSGQTYELGGPVQYSFRELLELLMGELGRKRWLVPMPMFAARLLAIFGQFLPTPPLTPDQLVLLQHDNVVKGKAFPILFGKAAALEDILPTYIHGSQAHLMQQTFDGARRNYRKGGL